MREWFLKQGDPLALSIAADARLCTPSYVDDQIWELSLSGGEPASLALYTTYGLRARSMRIFPRFIEGDTTRMNPLEFYNPPIVRQFYPNFLLITFSPFPDLEVIAEYWVPQSQIVAGRFQITNLGTNSSQVRLELAVTLIPTDGGERMGSNEYQAIQVLSGRTGGLVPVLFINGGAAAAGGSYPSLTVTLDLPVGGKDQFVWSQAACHTFEESCELARSITLRPWDSECAKIEMLNAGNIEIHTGDINWDAAFALTQKVALGLIHGSSSLLPCPSFVQSRRPDDGFSIHGDGSDHGYLWNGQSPFETFQSANLLLPAAPQLLEGFIRNYLWTQREDGFIDLKPGLGGQRSNRLASPLLTSLVWRIYQTTSDLQFLDEVFPKLLKYWLVWFTRQHDRDRDGIPEWDSPTQMCYDDHPLFSSIHTWALGLDITTVKSPSLCALLYQEGKILIQIAQLLNRQEVISELREHTNLLQVAVENSWDKNVGMYAYWDRDAHLFCQDQTLLLPLWAGIPSQKIADKIIQNTITSPSHFWQPFGIPACPVEGHDKSDERWNVHILWNSLIGEGLLQYGYYAESAVLITRLMQAIVQSLKSEGAFRSYYHSQTGQGLGERNTLSGLAPVALFLKTLGVFLISPCRVMISGSNPFPWPVTIKYRGMTVLRQKNKTMVIFPNGQIINVKQPDSCLVKCD